MVFLSLQDLLANPGHQAVYHNGPLALYLSPATGDVKSYKGDGKWAKIAELGK